MSEPATEARREREWFAGWLATLQRHLSLHAQILDDTLQRAAEIEWCLERGIGIDVVRHAHHNQTEQWASALHLLGTGLPLAEILAELFGTDVPVTVAAAALETIVQDEPGSDRPDVLIGRELRKRETECKAIGFPRYLWLVTLRGKGKADVTVIERAKLRGPHFGLVKVVDAR